MLVAAVVAAILVLVLAGVLLQRRTGDDLVTRQLRDVGTPARPSPLTAAASSTTADASTVAAGPTGAGPTAVGPTTAGPTTAGPVAAPVTLDDAAWRRVQKLALLGRRVQAIELARSLTGCTMTEAKALVDTIPRGSAWHDGDTAVAAHDLLREVRDLVRQNRPADAAQRLHEATGIPRAEADEAVRHL